MPIRFSCPDCGQKLSVAERLVGNRLECPHCKQSLVVPELPNRPPEQMPAKDQPPTAAPASPTVASLPPLEIPPAAASASCSAEPITFSGIELIYDTATVDRPRQPPPTVANVIVVPRYVLYVQGGLLAAVALVAFAIGIAMGYSLAPQPPANEQTYRVAGSVTHLSGPRRLPDADAVVLMLPQKPHPPTRKIPIAGFAPSDPAPDPDSKSLSLLRSLGGVYARTDSSGRFQLEAPRRGRYLIVILAQRPPSGAAREPTAADASLLAPFFSRPAALLGGHRYKILQEVIDTNQELTMTLE